MDVNLTFLWFVQNCQGLYAFRWLLTFLELSDMHQLIGYISSPIPRTTGESQLQELLVLCTIVRVLRNEEDKRKGVDYVMNKILGFYKECLELQPEYLNGLEEGEVNAGDGVRINPDGVASPATVIYYKEKPESSLDFCLDDSWITI
ncbi:hypothetical protein Tco_1473469 [Tanacetum coccineum]